MKAVIFDMDGVIVDNNAYHKKAWQECCANFNVPFDDGVWSQICGRNNRDTLDVLFQGTLDETQMAEYAGGKETTYRKLYEKHIQPVSGLLPFIEHIRKCGLRISLASSAGRENIDFVLDHLSLREFFDVITAPETIRNGKPDPEIYLKTAELLKLRPDECVVFEDSLSGIESAHRAGMKVIGVTTTHSSDEMNHTEFTISDFNELLNNPEFHSLLST